MRVSMKNINADNEQDIKRLEKEEESIIKEIAVLEDKLRTLTGRWNRIKSEILRKMRT